MIIIQESDRSMIIPEGEKYLGASMDKDVVCKRFHIDRYTIDGDDKVNASVIRVLYCVNDKVYDSGIVTEMDYEEEGDYIEFPWVPSAACMQGPGTRGVSICIQWYSEDGETVTNDWNSGIGTFIVTESLHEPSDEEVEGSRVIVDSEVLTQLNNSLSGLGTRVTSLENANSSTGVSGTGITQEAKTLLISILRKALFDSDMSSAITSLSNALSSNGGTSGGSSTETPNIPSFTVTVNATNCTVNSSSTVVNEGGIYIGSVTPNENFDIDSITVVMGDENITDSAYENGNITINSVIGNIVITVSAKEQDKDVVQDYEWKDGYRIVNGNEQGLSSVCCTEDYISIDGVNSITVSALTSIKVFANSVFYTESKAFISPQIVSTVQLGSEVESHIVSIPDNAKYVKFSATGTVAQVKTRIAITLAK